MLYLSRLRVASIVLALYVVPCMASLTPLFYLKKILTTRLQLMTQAEKYLGAIHGFEPLIKLLHATHETHMAKGFWFELEAGISIMKRYNAQTHDEKITAFHYRLHNPTCLMKRELDIITNKRCIECKNIEWKKLTPDQQATILQKLLEQKNLFHYYNTHNIPVNGYYNLKYMVWSARPIPSSIKKCYHIMLLNIKKNYVKIRLFKSTQLVLFLCGSLPFKE